MADYEDTSRFMIVLQDAVDGIASIPVTPAHVFRIHLLDESDTTDKPTGLPTFDDALKPNEETGQPLVTEQQLLDFYHVSSMRELGTRYVNVESNIAVEGAGMRKPYSGLGYRAIFEVVQAEHKRGVVAYQNPEAMVSLGHLGLRSLPLVGNPELSVVNDDKGKKGERYFPLTVESEPWSRVTDGSAEHNYHIFTDPAYAKTFSRIAGMVAMRPLNVINLL
jgi:hypothetical protein